MAQKPRRPPSRPRQQSQNNARSLKRKREVENIDALSQRVADLEVKLSTPPQDFSDLPLSQPTQAGLEASHFKKLTTIQSSAIPAALKGRDILGAAKTGSGKTLAFLVPVLENLYRKRWTEYDGLGALILSPTRELAVQIFEVLRKVGRNHAFSAGLVIGGKSLQEERERLGRMNILVATPGRMLQHMDQTADFGIENLQMLILDEADRIMDMGFQTAIDAIVDHLPKDRQTLLFSATQTKKINDLVRLSLTEPEFVSVHETANTATPSKLQQNYIVTPLPEKLDVLWSFIRANVKKKILVFLSSGKQVRFVYEAFRHLQPGIPLLHLHGGQKQTARLDITTRFSRSQHACLFATDVAARGLDFPSVDWVVQADAPENAETYIHRVGRTARFEREGHSVLLLDPSEESGMLSSLEKKRVFLEKISVRQKKMQDTLKTQLQNMCFKDPELKYLGQKAFVNYVKSVHVMPDKETFQLKELDLEGFASSLGLPGAPRVKFLNGNDTKARKNMPRALAAAIAAGSDESNDDEEDAKPKQQEKSTVRTKYDRMFERRNQDVLAEHYAKLIEDDGGESATKDKVQNNETTLEDADEDNDFLSVKRRFVAGDSALGQAQEADTSSDDDSGPSISGGKPALAEIGINPASSITSKKRIQLSSNPDEPGLVIDSKRREKLLKSKKALLKYKGHGSHLVFSDNDDEGKEKVYYEKEDEFAKKGNAVVQREEFLSEEKQRKEANDIVDKELEKQKRREKKEKRRDRERKEIEGGAGGRLDEDENGDEDEGVQLVPYEENDKRGTVDMDIEEERPKKRERKWFERGNEEDDDDVQTGGKKGKKSQKRRQNVEEMERPQTLEDLEVLASGLLTR
ncbi:ATP-dependent RNA helicase dbp4 [Neophaeococcomyces mojaviensis]|uniref:ATP-dependent RNA helicase dbp4 n=1 Tax=Neophaeococcomyces mojaviensis TaxID=3383035 RepID=A0ACC2ZZI8_9EURO|nr:ATP-dependent RNA helicase dbp4 [Knufia sp. JES_112]